MTQFINRHARSSQTQIEIPLRRFHAFAIVSDTGLATDLVPQLEHEGLAVHTFEEVEIALQTLSAGPPFAPLESTDLIFLQQPPDPNVANSQIRKILAEPLLANVPLVMASNDRHYRLLMKSVIWGAVDYVLLPSKREKLARHLHRLLGLGEYAERYRSERAARSFHKQIRLEIKRSKRAKAPFTIFLGHLQFGQDTPLEQAEELESQVEEIAQKTDILFEQYLSTLSHLMRETDALYPLGMREFLAVLPFTTKQGAEIALEKMEAAFLKVTSSLHNSIRLSLKLGSATYPDDAQNKENLLTAAEERTEI